MGFNESASEQSQKEITMRNEYGEQLDSNGYAPSIIQTDTSHCWFCGRNDQKLDRHEPFNGAFRQKSKAYGMWVVLCHERCHMGKAHKDAGSERTMKRIVQARAMHYYDWNTEDFIARFGKNWL